MLCRTISTHQKKELISKTIATDSALTSSEKGSEDSLYTRAKHFAYQIPQTHREHLTDARTLPKAIIQNTVGNQTYIVTIDDTLDLDTTVTDIQPKQVTLEKIGQKPRTLNLNPTPWIK